MKLIIVNKGGKGSGDFGHSGRPGKIGGSSGGKGGSARDEQDIYDATARVQEDFRRSQAAAKKPKGGWGGKSMSAKDAKKQFPNTMYAVDEMAGLNDAGEVNNKFNIPAKWAIRMEKIEPVFADARKRKSSEIPLSKFPKDYNDRGEYDVMAAETFLTNWAGGEELFQNAIRDWYNAKGMPGTLAYRFLEEVFDGELSEMLR